MCLSLFHLTLTDTSIGMLFKGNIKGDKFYICKNVLNFIHNSNGESK